MPAQTKEAKDAPRLCNLEPGSPEYRARLGEVQDEIKERAAEAMLKLSLEAGMSLETFARLTQNHTIGDLYALVERYGRDYAKHLDEIGALGEQEGSNIGGWIHDWELERDQ